MSDLVSRLAARVTDPDVLRAIPRTVPRFAPDASGTAVTSADASPPTADTATGEGPSPTRDVIRPGGRDHPGGVDPAPGTTRTGPDPILGDPPWSRASTATDAGTASRPVVVEPHTPGNHPIATPRHAPTSPPYAGSPSTGAADGPGDDPAAPRPPGQPIVVAAEPTTTDASASSRPPGDRAPVVVARPGPAPARANGPAAPDDPPVIQVRIGRLEVRAAPDPAPAQRRRTDSPAPDTTLAEYLRGHRGPR